jgi:hypothetical protein
MKLSDINHLHGETRHWVMGTICGFPVCCIQDFIDDPDDHTSGVPWEPRKLTGTGYVPCPSCNTKTEDQLREAIAARRVSPKPFPESPWDNTCNRYPHTIYLLEIN